MAAKKGSLSISSENIFPIIKKWVYSDHDIFARELVSNGCDAITKLKKLDMMGEYQLPDDYKPAIKVEVNPEEKTLKFTDNGLGMTADEVEEYITQIAFSGATQFLEKYKDKTTEDDMIGHFGLGFYSAFMVAKDVRVITKKAGSDEAYEWVSAGEDGYEITPCTKETNGTTIILTLKEDTDEEKYSQYLETYELKELIKKYSGRDCRIIRPPYGAADNDIVPANVSQPFIMWDVDTEMKEGAEESEKPEYETVVEDQTLNSMVPLWKRQKSKITDEEYNQFYKDHFYDYQDPQKVIHFSVEGNTSFTALLYIPSHLPQGFYSQDYKKGLQLYCRGVFIMDHAEELLPDSLRFVKGLVDSQDLSLNISREMLQHDHQLKLIAGRIEKKVLNELGNMLAKDREAYEKFFEEFGVNLKFGVYNNYGMDKEKFQDLLLFYSSREKKYVTLSEYVSRMKEDQKDIYFVSGKDVELIDKMPVVQTLKNKEFEVLYLTDEVDEFVMQTLMNYKEKTFRNAAQGDLDLDTEEEKEALNKSKEENKDLLTFMKEALGDEVAEVKLSNKLTEDPVCLTAGEGISFEMEKVFANMPNQSPMPMKATRILEINPNHPIFETLKTLYASDKDKVKEVTEVLYDQACLIEGFAIKDPIAYSKKICELLVK